MLNIRHLVYPTPSDGNLHPQSDGLTMLREGSNDTNRFFYYANLPKQKLNNLTNDQFNHTRSTGVYNNGITSIYNDHVVGANSKGGIVPFPPKHQQQYIGDELSNNPVPLLNALVNWKLNKGINELVDAPLPPQLNPISKG